MKDTNVSLASQCMSHIFQAVDDHNKAFTFTKTKENVLHVLKRERDPHAELSNMEYRLTENEILGSSSANNLIGIYNPGCQRWLQWGCPQGYSLSCGWSFWGCTSYTLYVTKCTCQTILLCCYMVPHLLLDDGFLRKASMERLQRKHDHLIQRVERGQRDHRCHPGLWRWGHQIEAHKVILASFSPFLMELLKKNKHPHPLIYMRGLMSEDLVAIVDFCI